ncbi:MalY/PatB family protein [Deinococcus maricopensis]|uniref:cysteine-S-conjugate beta-lyase n=1 Tax=Deinococcus maricopensis (strain DSM 21211 / LMG 22137 / NRRL B-23946 / LB-34) TaxID=709986 RepID=E8U7I5_DEIML|nr:PatB family C-S lyase [Deinococcus maricopensis]ADV67024.1 Cystathionine beta-lyase [Deinococcus maricopensis DSM 21211]
MTHAPLDALTPDDLRHADSYKWTKYPEGVLPLWVADMDFPVAPGITRALTERLSRGLGYHQLHGDAPLMARLHAKLRGQGLTDLPDEGWVHFLPGVVPGLYAAVRALTSAGDDVITMTPIYPPFLSAITDQGRTVREAPLQVTADGWRIDWAALDAAVTPATRLLMLCNPHNPTGRVWTADELTRLADFAAQHRLWVVTDELHADLTLDGTFTPFAAVRDDLRERTITLTGPCKAYNTAGLGIGAAVSHNPALIARLARAGQGLMGHPSALSVTMWRAALEEDGTWLAGVLAYLRGNRDFVADFLRERLPQVHFHAPEATYLAWLDLRATGHGAGIAEHLLAYGLALNDGATFGAAYAGYARLNFATSRAILTEALTRLERALT